jgi:TRAP-type C4-dicarboxylate transport system permease small subunit
MVNDCGLKSVNGFWLTLWIRLGTLLNMSSSRHLEADGLTERVNNTLQQFLRCFICCYDG